MLAQRPLSRRGLLATIGAGLAAPAILSRPAGAAEFSFKLSTTIPEGHPINDSVRQAAEAIGKESGGRLEVQVFPGYMLGSSTATISQLRDGSLELATMSGAILSTLVPVTTVYNTAYAFQGYDQVWKALDGSLGNFLRKKVDAVGLHAFDKHWDLGFRQITTSSKPIQTPEDLRGMKLRVPVAPLFLACFKALGASPTAINFDELYPALQTKLVDGEENDLITIQAGKLYEVQKYCSITNHIWDGYFTLANGARFRSLPDDLKTILSTNLDKAAVAERAAVVQRMDATRQQLQKAGLTFNDPDQAAFRAALKKAGFYAETKAKFGDEVWSLLEAATGPLA